MMVAEARRNETHQKNETNDRNTSGNIEDRQQSHGRSFHGPQQTRPQATGEQYVWPEHYGRANYGPAKGVGWQNRRPLSNGAMTTISEAGREITLVSHGSRRITARIGDKFGIGGAIFRIVSYQTRSGNDRHGTVSKPMVESVQIGGGRPPADYELIMVGNRLRLCAETVAQYHPSRTYRHNH